MTHCPPPHGATLRKALSLRRVQRKAFFVRKKISKKKFKKLKIESIEDEGTAFYEYYLLLNNILYTRLKY